ncbi:MAG: hypothetical protein IKR52_08190, partial [Paludibacteraceae bacterium]|nr:hypothetical protein [Paludibacteraceae bacterium]
MKKIIYLILLLSVFAACSPSIDYYTQRDSKPTIYPDYTDIVIPVNIAPLNFMIASYETLLAVDVTAKNETVRLKCHDNRVIWNERQWRKLLADNVGDTLFYTAYIDTAGLIVRCLPFWQVVSPD